MEWKSTKWASFTAARLFTEFLNYASYATAEELDVTSKVYRYDGSSAGIRCDPISGQELVINGGINIYL